jgi:hypothetical protein
MTPVDAKLYTKVKKEADAKFLAKTSIYKSAWIVRRYKQLGGTYAAAPTTRSTRTARADTKHAAPVGLKRWFLEEWVDINRYVVDDKGFRKYAPCGRKNPPHTYKKSGKNVYPLCRPLKRVNKHTPVTLGELSPAVIARAKKEKKELIKKGNKHIVNAVRFAASAR